MTEDAPGILPSISSAGCVFIGDLSAVAFGDYIAGPSHVLPTGGTAGRLSGLRAEDFTHVMNVVSYTNEGLLSDSADAVRLAKLEGLSWHAKSIELRSSTSVPHQEV
jgi:histidinol dehydrogenase